MLLLTRYQRQRIVLRVVTVCHSHKNIVTVAKKMSYNIICF